MTDKVAKPGTKLRALDILEGKWVTQRTFRAVGGKKAAEMRAIDTYEWLPGKFFMMHLVDARMDGVAAQSIEIMGYHNERKCYATRSYDDHGESAEFTARLDGRAWEIDRDTMRFRGTFVDDATRLS